MKKIIALVSVLALAALASCGAKTETTTTENTEATTTEATDTTATTDATTPAPVPAEAPAPTTEPTPLPTETMSTGTEVAAPSTTEAPAAQ